MLIEADNLFTHFTKYWLKLIDVLIHNNRAYLAGSYIAGLINSVHSNVQRNQLLLLLEKIDIGEAVDKDFFRVSL